MPSEQAQFQDRIKSIFAVLSPDHFPEVSMESLSVFHKLLTETLSFPFTAEFDEDNNPFNDSYRTDIQVNRIMLPDKSKIDELGLVCEALLGGHKVTVPLCILNISDSMKDAQAVKDYQTWFSVFRK